MARKLKQAPVEVQKFGGVDELGVTKLDGQQHELNSIETQSKTSLESDLGVGNPVIMRAFTFELNKEAFKALVPSKQELFDTHVRGIEMALFRDGLIFEKRHEPHILFNKKNTRYTIFVVATPARGQTVVDKTQTLSQIAHG